MVAATPDRQNVPCWWPQNIPGKCRMPDRRSALLAALAAAAPALPRPSLGQGPATAWPDRPVRYIVPFTPAGITDIMARLVAQKMSEIWRQPVVVENRAGGNALIGAEAAARATPDGHTLLAITLTHAVNASLYPNAGYVLLRDFAPVSMLGALPLVVVVNANSPWRSMAELVAALRSRQMNAGSAGNGSPPHLGLELLRRAVGAGPGLLHVPYRGGAPGVTDLVAGNLDLIVSNLPECLPQLQGGRLRGLAVTAAARHPLIPEVPTVAEAGLPELVFSNWTAMLTQAAVPQAVLARIEQAAMAATQDPSLRRRAEEGGFEVLGWDAERTRATIQAEVERWSRLVAQAGIRGD
jgi:tripartite-type tricarboxylate transporter receptor subunit TctC